MFAMLKKSRQEAPVTDKGGAEDDPPGGRVVPVNVATTRTRRAKIAEDLAKAEAELKEAEGHWRRTVSEAATFGASVGASEHRRNRDDAEANVTALREALALLDAELAVYADPSRKAALQAQKFQCGKLALKRAETLAEAEKIIAEQLIPVLREYYGLRDRMAAALGHGLGWEFSDASDRKFLSLLFGKHLAAFLDGEVYAHALRVGDARDPRPWSERESARLDERVLPLLEDLS